MEDGVYSARDAFEEQIAGVDDALRREEDDGVAVGVAAPVEGCPHFLAPEVHLRVLRVGDRRLAGLLDAIMLLRTLSWATTVILSATAPTFPPAWSLWWWVLST